MSRRFDGAGDPVVHVRGGFAGGGVVEFSIDLCLVAAFGGNGSV
jgi:hypothetical protein